VLTLDKYLHYHAIVHVVKVATQHVFQALADPTRVRIVRLLAITGEEVCLCELVDSLHEPQYKLSRHLKTLKQAGLVSAEKEGRWIYHRLIETIHLKRLYDAIKALDAGGVFSRDLKRFKQRMRLR
jgi:ArsR family transcriptional regulator